MHIQWGDDRANACGKECSPDGKIAAIGVSGNECSTRTKVCKGCWRRERRGNAVIAR
jgi:hypothetical protein